MITRGLIGEAVKTRMCSLHESEERDSFGGLARQADPIAGAPGPCSGEERASTGSCRADGTDAVRVPG